MHASYGTRCKSLLGSTFYWADHPQSGIAVPQKKELGSSLLDGHCQSLVTISLSTAAAPVLLWDNDLVLRPGFPVEPIIFLIRLSPISLLG